MFPFSIFGSVVLAAPLFCVAQYPIPATATPAKTAAATNFFIRIVLSRAPVCFVCRRRPLPDNAEFLLKTAHQNCRIFWLWPSPFNRTVRPREVEWYHPLFHEVEERAGERRVLQLSLSSFFRASSLVIRISYPSFVLRDSSFGLPTPTPPSL